MRPIRRFLRPFLLALAVLATPPAGYAGYLRLSGNVHAVEPGVLYRSGQLSGERLRAVVEQYGIRTIVNLRGENPEEDWYRDEVAVAKAEGVVYVPIRMSARSMPKMQTMMKIASTLRDAPRPILVHCFGGADRTGLASAIFERAIDGETVADAAGQLSFAYGHFPWLGSRTAAMDRAFAEFAVAWAASENPALAARD